MAELQGMDSVARAALGKLRRACSIAKKGKELDGIKTSCESIIQALGGEGGEASNGSAEGNGASEPQDKASSIFQPFKLAFDSQNPRVIEEALDGLHELLAHGYLPGSSETDSEPSKKVADVLVDSVCGCGCVADEQVQMQVIRILQTSVVAEPSYVHSHSLLQCVRTCFNIFLGSSSQANQSAAKAALSRMVNVMMKRLEGLPVESPTPRESGDDMFSGSSKKMVEEIAKQQEKEASALENKRPSLSPSTSQTEASVGQEYDDYASQEEKDVYEVFYRLCKLSMKFDLVDSWVKPDETMNLQSKVLSLELLLAMLRQSGPVFRNSAKFITCIKQHLCMSLLKNGVSSAPRVFNASLQVFVTLILHFKTYLKQEIGVFFTSIFLRILESPNATFQQKVMVLQLCNKICQDPQTVVDIYVNYDCDLKANDIFAKMLNQLAKIVQSGTHSAGTSSFTPEQEAQLRSRGTEALVAMTEALVEWSKKVEKDFVWQDGVLMPKSLEKIDSDVEQSSDIEPAPAVPPPLVKQDSAVMFLKQKEHKIQLQQAIKLFNQKPKKGVDLLVQIGHIEKTAECIAAFFHDTQTLDKVAIGEYMGEPDEFNKSVLYAYVDSLSFVDMTIDAALRHFLSGFWLPGEAQKIDRMMEKFAERYCKDTNAFSNADTAYVLAYSIIMLSTDAHNPKVAKKMTKEEYVKMNRGINDGADLPQDYLEQIYDRIVATPFKLKDEPDSNGAPAGADGVDKTSSQEKYRAEAQQLMSTAQGLLKRAAHSPDDEFYSASKIQLVYSMLELGWAPLLAAFSVLMEESQEARLVTLCLRGMVAAISMLSVLEMPNPRDAFVSTLTQFTNLHSHAVRELKQKNIDSINATITVAQTTGNYLGSSWGPILRCISQLDRLQLISSRQGGAGPGGAGEAAMIEEANSLKIEEVDTETLDRIFSSSARLSDEAIVDFVKHLCSISREEIEGSNSSGAATRTFSMQKIVEITYFNMTRIRIVWSRIWMILAEHFQAVMLHPNVELSMYAIDSMRQLALKFLEKGELTSFHFQRDFLKPFDHVIANSKNAEIRELVVRCLTQVVRSTARNIKSGWKNAFQILHIAGRDRNEQIVLLAFDLLRKIVQESFPQIVSDEAHGSAAYVDCINCLTTYASNEDFTAISLEAIELIQRCTSMILQNLATGEERLSFGDAEQDVRLWFPVLTGLSRISSDSRQMVRAKALDALFDVLLSKGDLFSPRLWELVFSGVLYPLFDDVYHMDEIHDTEWLRTTLRPAMIKLTELFATFFPAVGGMLRQFLKVLTSCVKHQNEQVAEIGLGSIKELLAQTAGHLTPEMWSAVCETMQGLFEHAGPLSDAETAEETQSVDQKLRIMETRHKIRMHLFNLVQDLCNDHVEALGDNMETLLNLLGTAHQTALESTTGKQPPMQGQLGQLGQIGAQQYMQWIYAESAEASRSELKFMFNAYRAQFDQEGKRRGSANADAQVAALESRLMDRVEEVFEKYSGVTSSGGQPKPTPQAAHAQVAASPVPSQQIPDPQAEQIRWILAPTLMVILEGFMSLQQPRFEACLQRMYPHLCALIESNDVRVRVVVTDLFLKKIGPALGIRATIAP